MEPDLQERKIELIQWLSVIDDASLLDKISYLKDQSIHDWWDDISDAERESISNGIVDAEGNKLKPHSEARSIYEKWL